MLDKTIYICDIEADGLIDGVTKIHCMSVMNTDTKEISSFTDYQDIIEFLNRADITIVMHNGLRYDLPVIRKILKIEYRPDVIDSLPLSWVLYETRKSHSLESYGEEFGIKKVKIEDWENGSIESYILRCEQDCRINARLWSKQLKYLKNIYGDDVHNLERYLKYLRFKMECVQEQEITGLRLDVNKAKKMFDELTNLKESKTKELEEAMPKVAIKKKKVYKDAYRDENGDVHQKGDLFFDETKELSDIEESKIIGWDEPNANSHVQIKNWLFSLGWQPQNILHKRDKKTNEIKLIPQIKSAFEPGEVCDSVKLLFKKEPKLEVLAGLSILTHRIGIFNGFIEEQKNGRLYPSMNGLTNTLRLQHRVIVNLPRFDRKYGREIRECLIADENCVLFGADLTGIEDSTKRHFIYNYDPEYVERMNIEGYDPHLELAILAKYMTKEDVEWYKEYEKKRKDGLEPVKEDVERYDRLKAKRYVAKTTNFAATYKVGAKALSIYPGINLGIKEAKRVIKTYWELNKAILDVEESLDVKEVCGQKWLFNPISRFWYSLRADKDRFSTLNQSTAVFVFDKWLTNIRREGIIIPFQYHDEIAGNISKDEKKNVKKVIMEAIKKVNDSLKLNVKIGCSVDFGRNYAMIH